MQNACQKPCSADPAEFHSADRAEFLIKNKDKPENDYLCLCKTGTIQTAPAERMAIDCLCVFCYFCANLFSFFAFFPFNVLPEFELHSKKLLKHSDNYQFLHLAHTLHILLQTGGL